jgi:hypothetical protein
MVPGGSHEMVNVRPPHLVLKNAITTWLSDSDFAAIRNLAKRSGVPSSVYLRTIIVDAIAEERELDKRHRTHANGAPSRTV